jgi:small subunit ribosomal protein S7
MPRKREVVKRRVTSDPRYTNQLVAKFTHCLMRKGKKNLAESILYEALDIIKQKSKEDPLVIFKRAVDNVKPVVEVKSRRVGGSTYQVPTEVRPTRSQALSIRWIISYARDRGEKSMPAKLAGELLDAANRRGTAIKKKEDTHRMADANKAFAHYRW